MDFETFFQSLFSLLKNSDDVYCVLYAVATCLLTQAFKKMFVNKVRVDILHKFDLAVVFPFVFSSIFAATDLIFVRNLPFSFDFVYKFVLSSATIGALSSVIFKLVSSLSGQSLKSLLKDDVFGAFYTQLLYFGNVRNQLVEKKLSLKDFLSQVKLVSANAVEIYRGDESAEVKKDKLFRLLEGVVQRDNIDSCVDVLNRTLIAISPSKQE